jgi:ABC-type bacteriocin/lantibiotic exporter with double-glycine peptidase domain
LDALQLTIFILGIFYLKSRGENSSLLTVAIFSLTLIRLIPSVSRIVSSAQHMKFFKPSIDIFFTDSRKKIFDKNEKKILISDKKFNKSIKIKNISFLYKNSKDLIFEKFNLEIKKNDVVGIIGDSGSGKSTLISILTGLMPVCSGAVFVDNQNIKKRKEWWFKQISYVPQKVTLFSNSLIENIIVDSHKPFDEKKIKDILSDLNLNYLFSRRNKRIEDINANKLSGGELQRIGIARALYKDSNVIFFDEITSSLDEKNEKKILKILKNLIGKKTIIITTHKKIMLKYCNKIIRL